MTIGVRSLSISPATLQLSPGASKPLTLKGLLSDGQAAPRSLLAGVAWSTSNSAVAVVETSGAVFGAGPGTAVVTAELGTARASAVVMVTATSNLAGGTPTPRHLACRPHRPGVEVIPRRLRAGRSVLAVARVIAIARVIANVVYAPDRDGGAFGATGTQTVL